MSVPVLRTSERTTFRRCQQRWWWGYREGLEPDGPPAPALWMGTGIHIALAKWYLPGLKRGVHPAKTWRRFCKAEQERWIRSGEDDFLPALDLGVGMLEGYVDLYGQDDHLDVLQPEYVGTMMVAGPDGEPVVQYVFTCDLVARNLLTGNIQIEEHKTCAAIRTGHLTLDDQPASYLPFMQEYLRAKRILKLHEKIDTIEYNFLRKDVPKPDDRPMNEEGLRLNKDGSVSKNQGAQAPLFGRFPVERNAHERQRVVQRIRDETQQMNEIRDRYLPVVKNTTPGCAGGNGESKCQFFEMCELHEQGGDWEGYRQMAMTVRDPYKNYRKVA